MIAFRNKTRRACEEIIRNDKFKNIYKLSSGPKYFKVVLKVYKFTTKHTSIARI